MEEVIKKEITDKLVDSEVVVEGGDSKFTVHYCVGNSQMRKT